MAGWRGGGGGVVHRGCDFNYERDGNICQKEQSEQGVRSHALRVIGAQRVGPHDDAAALLLLLLLQLLQLPVNSNGEFTIGQQHVHGNIRVPQACGGAKT